MTPRRVAFLSSASLACALGACGGGEDAAPPAAAKRGDTSGAASRSPAQSRLEDAGAALLAAGSFHVEATLVDAVNGTGRLRGVVGPGGAVSITVRNEKGRFDTRVVEDVIYTRADRRFLESADSTAETVRRYAGKWLEVPRDSIGPRGADRYKVEDFVRCLSLYSGTAQDGGSASVEGKPVRVVRGRGDQPGTAAGRIFLSARGKPLPLRFTRDGPSRPQSTTDSGCAYGNQDAAFREDWRLSRFGGSVDIQAPDDPIDLDGG